MNPRRKTVILKTTMKEIKKNSFTRLKKREISGKLTGVSLIWATLDMELAFFLKNWTLGPIGSSQSDPLQKHI